MTYRARIVIAILLVACFTSAYAGLPETVERIKPGVVAVGTSLITRAPPVRFLGTGFAIADGRHVVTNAHVLEQAAELQKGERLIVFFAPTPRTEQRAATVVASDPAHDLALLRVEGAPLTALDLGDPERVREGETYAFTGYPIGTLLGLRPVTHRALVAAITPIAVPQLNVRFLSPKIVRQLKEPYPVFQLDATAYPGNSGSPLFDPETGRVMGILNSVFVKESREHLLDRPSGIAYAIPAGHIRALLSEAGL